MEHETCTRPASLWTSHPGCPVTLLVSPVEGLLTSVLTVDPEVALSLTSSPARGICRKQPPPADVAVDKETGPALTPACCDDGPLYLVAQQEPRPPVTDQPQSWQQPRDPAPALLNCHSGGRSLSLGPARESLYPLRPVCEDRKSCVFLRGRHQGKATKNHKESGASPATNLKK